MRLNNLSVREAAALTAYVAALQARFRDQLVDVLLFGSRARGDAQPGSDIDVLVMLNNSIPKAFSDARGLGFDILLTHEVFLSIRVMSKQQWQKLADIDSLFYRNLRRDGISLLPEPA
jgi:predicted nucleotidyltransferase